MRRQDNERHWVQIINAARSYGAGIAAYCRDNAIAKKSYYFWFGRLKKDHPEWQEIGRGRKSASVDDKPQTEVTGKARRRKFTEEYKSRILRETDDAQAGKIGEILRREGLYSSTLTKWRQERAQRALAPKKRGPAVNPLAAENKRLQEENSRLQKKLAQAHDIIEVQKKIASILGTIDQSESN